MVVAQHAATRTKTRPQVATWGVGLFTVFVAWFGARTLVGHGVLGASLAAGRVQLVGPYLLVTVLAVLVCERVWPAEPRPLLSRGHLQDATFFVLYATMVVPLMTFMSVGFAALLGTYGSWVEAPWTAAWPRWALVTVTLILMDLCNWLAHWADHRYIALWRLHAVHHTQEEISVLTSFRAHPIVHVTGFLLATIPVVALTGFHPLAPVLITLYLCLGTVTHANLRWSFGPLGKILVSPTYHRMHHAVDAPAGANLGVVLTIWDVMTHRADFAESGASVARTGLPGRPLRIEQTERSWRPLGLLGHQLVQPFSRKGDT
jgi:sterol desaturase/sphingolipid hydroxylase (fatty acid hydroxylase superfamily)